MLDTRPGVGDLLLVAGQNEICNISADCNSSSINISTRIYSKKRASTNLEVDFPQDRSGL